MASESERLALSDQEFIEPLALSIQTPTLDLLNETSKLDDLIGSNSSLELNNKKLANQTSSNHEHTIQN